MKISLKFLAIVFIVTQLNALSLLQPVSENLQTSVTRFKPADIWETYNIHEGQLLNFNKTYPGTFPYYDNITVYNLTTMSGASMLNSEWAYPLTSTFQWTPDYCHAGNYYFKIEYWDFGSPNYQFNTPPLPDHVDYETVTVSNVNRAPSVSGIPCYLSVRAGRDSVTFPITATVLDESACTGGVVSVNQIPVSLGSVRNVGSNSANNLKTYTYQYSWTPTSSDIGRKVLSFTITDMSGRPTKKSVTVDILPKFGGNALASVACASVD